MRSLQSRSCVTVAWYIRRRSSTTINIWFIAHLLASKHCGRGLRTSRTRPRGQCCTCLVVRRCSSELSTDVTTSHYFVLGAAFWCNFVCCHSFSWTAKVEPRSRLFEESQCWCHRANACKCYLLDCVILLGVTSPPIIFKVYSWISWALPGWKWNRVHRTNATTVEILPSPLTRVCLTCALTCLTWQFAAVRMKLLPDQEQTLLGTAKRWGDMWRSGVLNGCPWIYIMYAYNIIWLYEHVWLCVSRVQDQTTQSNSSAPQRLFVLIAASYYLKQPKSLFTWVISSLIRAMPSPLIVMTSKTNITRNFVSGSAKDAVRLAI